MRLPADQRTPRSRGVSLATAAVLALTLGAAFSCSVTEKNYTTLSFFFDGVPDPNAKAKGGPGAVALDMASSPTYSVHKPYAAGACAECHSQAYELTPQDSGICMKCHKDRTNEYPKMHGPVAAAACLWCHAPHESAEAHLMKKPAREVCLQCHEAASLSVERVPEHADAARSCLDCHSGHGGTASFFLRPKPDRPTAPAEKAGPKEPAPQ